MAKTPTSVSITDATKITLDGVAFECLSTRSAIIDQLVSEIGPRLDALRFIAELNPKLISDGKQPCALSVLGEIIDRGLTEWALRVSMTPQGHRLSPHWLERQRSFPEAFDEIKLAMDDARGGRRANGTRHLYVFVPSDLVGLPPGFVAPHYRPHGEEAGIIDPDPAADPEPSDDR